MRYAFTLIAGLLLVVPAAQAQQSKNVRQGYALAQRVCSICHGTVPGAASAVAGAPNFMSLAEAPGQSAGRLRAALDRPHHSMPNLALTRDELRDVSAYILSLRPAR